MVNAKTWMNKNIRTSKLKRLFKKAIRQYDNSLQHIPADKWYFDKDFYRDMYQEAKRNS